MTDQITPDLATKRLELYRHEIKDTDDDDPVPNDLWFAMDRIHLIAWATCYPSGYVRYISVVDGFRRKGFGLEMCLALDEYYRGQLSLQNTMDGGGDELAAAFERESPPT